MEMRLSTSSYGIDDSFDSVLCWGDPILPQTWQQSEAENSANFPLPGEGLDMEYEDDSGPLILAAPPLDRDLVSLMKYVIAADRPSCEYLSEVVAENVETIPACRDDVSTSGRRDVDMESRSSFDDCTASVFSDSDISSEGSILEEEHEDFDSNHPPVQMEAQESKVDWTIEAHYEKGALCFKLRTAAGVYIQLMADEITGSIEALLEDAMETIQFCIRCVDGHVIYIDSTYVVSVVSRILEQLVQPTQHVRETPSLGSDEPTNCCKPRLAPQDYVAEKKRHSRIGSAWRAFSTRGKIRPKPPARVE